MAGEAELVKVGLALVAQNLGKFQGDVGKAEKSLGGLKSTLSGLRSAFASLMPQPTTLEKAFSSLGKTVKNFAENIVQRILVIAFGVLVRDSIRKVIDAIGEMIGSFIDASNEFQRLRVRLNTFNMQPLIEGGMSFNDAMQKATKSTKEQLDWVLKLAKTTPYDATDVANAYSLARSYGFIDQKAKTLTDSIMEFASGMALDNTAIEKIITNFGQMMQQGKITGTELRDLARGAFVPVNKVLEIAAKNLGITTEEMNKLRKAGTAKPEWFIDAFIQLVGKDFKGASERMSRTFKSAVDNMKDTIVGLAGLKIGIPIFDILGGKIADLVEAFDDIRYAKLSEVFDRIGASISRIIDRIFGLLPGATSIADTIINIFDKIATWFEKNEDTIVGWVRNAIDWLERLYNTFVSEILPVLTKFFTWIYNNREAIWKWIKVLVTLWLINQLATIAIRLFLYAIIKLLGWIISTVAKVMAFNTALSALTIVASFLGLSLGEIIAFLGLLAAMFVEVVLGIIGISYWIYKLITDTDELKAAFNNAIGNIVAKFQNTPWWQIGSLIINGIIAGVTTSAIALYNVMAQIANSVMNIWNSIFGIHSPSVEMEKVGNLLMEGMYQGIVKGAKKTLGAVKDTANAVVSTVTNAVTGSATSTTTGGGATSTGGHYLGQTGDLMNKKLDATKGTDPCGKSGPAKCVSDAIGKGIAGGLSGVGSGILSALDDWTGLLGDLVNGIGEESKAGNEAFNKKLSETSFGFNESVMKLADGTAKEVQKITDNGIWNIAEARSFYEKWTAITSRDQMEQLKDTGYSMSSTTIQKMQGVHDKAVATMAQNAANVMGFVNTVAQAVLSWLKSNSNSNSNSNSQSNSNSNTWNSHTTTTQITNNFNGKQSGKQVTWDTENAKFWI